MKKFVIILLAVVVIITMSFPYISMVFETI